MALTQRLFSRWDGPRWIALALVVLTLLYTLYTTGMLLGRGLFETVGGDYRAFRASAEIALSIGFAQVYDLDTQEEFQRPLYDAYARLDPLYATVPTPYFPAFILLFVPFMLLPPPPSFLLWTGLNVALLVLYLRRFTRVLAVPLERGLLAVVLLSYCSYLNVLFGQVNVFLLVGLGEFYLAIRQGREFRGGLWLGLMLLKPQSLLLLLPGLLLGRRWRAVAGAAAAGLAVLGVSLLLGGTAGLQNLARLVFQYSEGLPTNVPQYMMNWRAVQANLEDLGVPVVGWVAAIAGMVVTSGLGLSLWFRPSDPASPRFALTLLGTYAATCAVTWHAHIQMAMPLLLLLLLLESSGGLPRKVLNAWALIPAAVFFVALLPLPADRGELTGFSVLLLNLYLVGWSLKRCGKQKHDPYPRGGDASEEADRSAAAQWGAP